MFDSVLVVCAGNICRSPTGEYVLKQKLEGKNIKVSSRLSTDATDGNNKLITRFQRASGADVTYTISRGCSSNCSANTIAAIFLACNWYTFAITPVCSRSLLRSTNTPLASAVASFKPPESLSA